MCVCVERKRERETVTENLQIIETTDRRMLATIPLRREGRVLFV